MQQLPTQGMPPDVGTCLWHVSNYPLTINDLDKHFPKRPLSFFLFLCNAAKHSLPYRHIEGAGIADVGEHLGERLFTVLVNEYL